MSELFGSLFTAGRSRAKAALVKRVRSVAVFSLGLRKAREAAAAASSEKAHTPHTPDRISSLVRTNSSYSQLHTRRTTPLPNGERKHRKESFFFFFLT